MWKKRKAFLEEGDGMLINLIRIFLVVGALVFLIVYYLFISELVDDE